jgi:flagellar hook-associated protein 2
VATESVTSSILTSMSSGSGIDITKLARDLADVEKEPKENRITTAKTASEAKISAYAVLKFNVNQLVGVFNSLNDENELATPSASSSYDLKVKVSSTNGSTPSGNYDFSVSSLAAAQRNISNQFSSASESLNSGGAFSLSITTASGTSNTVSIAAGADTPQGIVSAINAANLDVAAALVAESDGTSPNYRVVLTGQTGSSNGFTVSSTLSDADLGFHDSSNGNSQTAGGINSQQSSADASISFNGLALTRSSNVLTDVIEGATVNLLDAHSSGDSTSITIASDRTTLKDKLQTLVSAYNDLRFALDEISDPESEEEEVGGALARDISIIRTVKDTIYRAITQDSSTASGSLNGLRDIGFNFSLSGDLNFDETTFDTVADTSFADVAMMLSAGTNDQSKYDGQAQGLAADAIETLDVLTDSIDGVFTTRTASARKAITDYETQLRELETRMEAVYERYLAQFTVMETLVNQLNSTRESLTDTWANMGNFNKK